MSPGPNTPGPSTPGRAPDDSAQDVELTEMSLPGLLRAARSTFALAIRSALHAAGLEDLPPNGPFVIGALARETVPLARVIEQLGVAKQTAGQLVDTLVVRGYLDRAVDPSDRRRLVVSLTDRGRAAAVIVRNAVDDVETSVRDIVGADALASARQVLAAVARVADHERAGAAEQGGR